MKLLDKLKLVYQNWNKLDKLSSPEINLDGYEEYKMVLNLKNNLPSIEDASRKEQVILSIPSEIMDKSESFKNRVLEGKL